MSKSINITFVSPAVFTWSDSDDNGGVVASGTATNVQAAGAAAVAAMKTYLTNQATNFTALNTNWQ